MDARQGDVIPTATHAVLRRKTNTFAVARVTLGGHWEGHIGGQGGEGHIGGTRGRVTLGNKGGLMIYRIIDYRYLLTTATLGQGEGEGGYIDGIIDYRYLLTTVTLGQMGGLMIWN